MWHDSERIMLTGLNSREICQIHFRRWSPFDFADPNIRKGWIRDKGMMVSLKAAYVQRLQDLRLHGSPFRPV
jgi:hypothetical protein